MNFKLNTWNCQLNVDVPAHRVSRLVGDLRVASERGRAGCATRRTLLTRTAKTAPGLDATTADPACALIPALCWTSFHHCDRRAYLDGSRDLVRSLSLRVSPRLSRIRLTIFPFPAHHTHHGYFAHLAVSTAHMFPNVAARREMLCRCSSSPRAQRESAASSPKLVGSANGKQRHGASLSPQTHQILRVRRPLNHLRSRE